MESGGEHVVWEGRPSWRSRMSRVVSGTFASVVAFVILLVVGVGTGIALLVLAAGIAVTAAWTLIDTIFWKYTVTTRRIFVRHGLVSVKEQTARLERVQDVTLTQSLFDRLFRVGTLDIDTAGGEGGTLRFAGLDDPQGVRELLDGAVRAEQATSL